MFVDIVAGDDANAANSTSDHDRNSLRHHLANQQGCVAAFHVSTAMMRAPDSPRFLSGDWASVLWRLISAVLLAGIQQLATAFRRAKEQKALDSRLRGNDSLKLRARQVRRLQNSVQLSATYLQAVAT